MLLYYINCFSLLSAEDLFGIYKIKFNIHLDLNHFADKLVNSKKYLIICLLESLLY